MYPGTSLAAWNASSPSKAQIYSAVATSLQARGNGTDDSNTGEIFFSFPVGMLGSKSAGVSPFHRMGQDASRRSGSDAWQRNLCSRPIQGTRLAQNLLVRH